jgi:hypothetical protein
MSRRLDKLPANNLQTRIASLQTSLQQLKTAQTAGSSSIVLTRTATGNSPDFTMTPTYDVVNIWKVTFTPNDPTLPNTGFIWHFFVNQTAPPTNTLQLLEQIPTNQYVRYIYAMGVTSGVSDTLPTTIVIYAIGGGTISIVQTA